MLEQDALMYAKKLKRDILTFSECVQVGLLLKMSQKEVQAALIYLHQHNNFFNNKFSPILFSEIHKCLLIFVNKVVAFSYQIDSGAHTCLPAEEWHLSEEWHYFKGNAPETTFLLFYSWNYEFPQAITLFTHLRVVAAF